MNEQTIWEGQSQTLTGAATGGRGAAKYRLTNLYLYFEKGILRTDAQQVPIGDVGDIDVKATMTQKARGVGDVVIQIHRPGRADETVTIEAIPKPRDVQRLINDTAFAARATRQQATNTHTYQGANPVPSTPVAPTAPPVSDPIEQIRKLGELRDAGILSEEEFAAKKAEILSRM